MQYRKQVSQLSSRIGLKNDIEISLLLRDRDTFERGENVLPFYRNIKKDGIELYGYASYIVHSEDIMLKFTALESAKVTVKVTERGTEKVTNEVIYQDLIR